MHAAVIGAGAFGGWTALFLRRRGWRVTLVDAWGPGNSRASSGGETRIIRSIYGDDRTSIRMTARSLALWKEHQERWQQTLYVPTGVVFLCAQNDPFLAASKQTLSAEGIAFQELSPATAARRYPQMSLAGVDAALFEPDAGVLFARENCRIVVEHFVADGGQYLPAAARPVGPSDGRIAVQLQSVEMLHADVYVFACGPWMGQLFPEVLGPLIRPTRQEVFFAGTPPGETQFDAASLPCWSDLTSEERFYGIPDFGSRGFKIASDRRGAAFDPSSEERVYQPASWSAAREYLRHRFPEMKDAKLLESRVCQYANSPDFGLIIDRHPEASNVWLAGGGSGHGYKQGPAVGEYLAGLIVSERTPDPAFGLRRFAT